MKKSVRGMTLTELLVAIVIISIFAIGIIQIDYKVVADRESSRSFQNKIMSTFEIIRNNAIIGRMITSTGTTALSWKIEIPSGTGGEIQVFYETSSGTYIKDSVLSYKMKAYEKITGMSCYDFRRTASGTTSTGVVSIQGSTVSLPNCGVVPKNKILEFTAGYKNFEKKIVINGVSGTIKLSD